LKENKNIDRRDLKDPSPLFFDTRGGVFKDLSLSIERTQVKKRRRIFKIPPID
jgi:hypothetical protein